MSPRREGRTQRCGAPQAEARSRRAERFLEAAELIRDETDPDFLSAAAALAVLAGIAAANAACCKALGRRSRSDNHHDAERLLGEITPGGREAANALRRLIDLKDEAHYGFYDVGKQDLERAMR
jgi:hypothetical protein